MIAFIDKSEKKFVLSFRYKVWKEVHVSTWATTQRPLLNDVLKDAGRCMGYLSEKWTRIYRC